MAFGRSNSLSINTGATNSLFASQQQNNPTSQPPAPGGLFGSSTQQSTQAGSLFGGPAAQQSQQTGGGLFGNSTSTSQPQQSGGLFGNTQNNATTGTQQSGGGGLFGSSLSQPTQQPQQQSGSLFGNTLNVPTQQTQQTSSLFGGLNQSTQQQQPQQQSGGLFSNLSQPAQQQQGSSLFGNTQQNRPSLFGASTTNNAAPAGGSLFSNPNPFGSSTQQQPQQQEPPQNSIFGLTAQAPAAAQSLLGASQYRSSQYQPFSGKLSMGQSANAPGVPQPQVQSAVKISTEEMRPTTRFADCIDEVQKQLEAIDKMILAQENFCRQIEEFIPTHGNNVATLDPDVEIVKEKADAAEGSLSVDASGIDSARKVLERDNVDFRRCERVVGNLQLPIAYRYTGNYGSAVQPAYTGSIAGADSEAARDMDLIGNYFNPMAADMKKTLDSYASNLSEIEGHMRGIEQSTVAQAQQLAARRAGAGGSGAVSGDDTVRELADTLRGFEASILGAAGLVGQCREGLNELMLGRLGGVVGRR